MKLVSLNIEYNKHYERVFPFMFEQEPDVICFQEVLEEDFLYLKESLGLEGVFKAHAYALSELDHYTNVYSRRSGVAIFSKKIVKTGYSFYWGKEEYSFLPFNEYKQNRKENRSYVLLWADIEDCNGEIYRCATTHFPVTENGESTPHQLEILPQFFECLSGLGDCSVSGDFNAPRGNETFRRIATLHKDNIPEKYLTSIDQNLHRTKGIMHMVDCLFTTPNYIASDVSLVDGVSDHMAIIATIDTI